MLKISGSDMLGTRIKLSISMLCWGLSFIAIKVALRVYPPLSLVTIRLFLTVVVLWSVSAMRRTGEAVPKGKDLLGLFLLGFLNPFCAFLLESYGMLDNSASITSIFLSTVPLLTPFVAFVFLLLVSFCGLVLIFSLGTDSGDYSIRGLIFLVFAVFIAIAYGIAARRLLKRYSPLTVVRYQQAFGFLLYLPLFFSFTDHRILPVSGIGGWQGLLAIVFLAIFPSALAYTFYVEGISKIGTSKANAFINLSPIVTSFASYFLLGETLGALKLAGIAIVIAGVFVSQLVKKTIDRPSLVGLQ
jgi:drug/metabolite transporter (DMT)-like permease